MLDTIILILLPTPACALAYTLARENNERDYSWGEIAVRSLICGVLQALLVGLAYLILGLLPLEFGSVEYFFAWAVIAAPCCGLLFVFCYSMDEWSDGASPALLYLAMYGLFWMGVQFLLGFPAFNT